MVGGALGSRSTPSGRTRGPASVPGPAGSQGQPGLQAGDHHRSQADRHHVLRRLLHLLLHRRADGAVHAHRTGDARAAVPVQRAVQPAVHHARHGDAAVLRHPDRVRVRQPRAAAADRCARRGLPPAERVVVLAVPVRRDDRDRRLHHTRRRRRLRLDRLLAADRRHPLAGCRRRPVDPGPGRRRSGHHPGRRQHDHHGGVHARARHDDVPDADLHLEHPGDVDPGADGLPAADRGAVRAGRRPPPRRARLRPGQRRRAAVAAPVLVLRPPRGVHHRVAVLRHRHRDLPGVLPQADLRLHHADLRDAVHRRTVGRGVGAPHVRHRRCAAAVLLVHDVPDRGADRNQVLQLDRHDVEGPVDI